MQQVRIRLEELDTQEEDSQWHKVAERTVRLPEFLPVLTLGLLDKLVEVVRREAARWQKS